MLEHGNVLTTTSQQSTNMSLSLPVRPEATDAISRLPFEIQGLIFVRCLPNEPTVPSANTAPLLLCHVCSKWRVIAISTPKLWDTLLLTFPYREYELSQPEWVVSAANLARLWFMNIKNSTLSLCIDWLNNTEIYLLGDVIQSHSIRLRTLDLCLPSEVDFSRFCTLSSIHVEQLEELSLYIDLSNAEQLQDFQSAPKLRKVSLYDSGTVPSNSRLIPLPWAQLTHLSIAFVLPSARCQTLLQECVQLQRCSLCVEFGVSDTTVGVRQATALPNLIGFTASIDLLDPAAPDAWFHDFTFPALEMLDLQYVKFSPGLVPALMRTLSLSTLRFLTISGFDIDIRDLVALLRATAAVTEFRLELDIETILDPNIDLLWNALTCLSHEASSCPCVLPRLKILDLCLFCEPIDTEVVKRCAMVVKSRWRPLDRQPTAIACLERVALHFVNDKPCLVEKAKILFGRVDFDGLDVQIDANDSVNDKSDWW